MKTLRDRGIPPPGRSKHKCSMFLLDFVLLVFVAGRSVYASRLEARLMESIALHDVGLYSRAIWEFRTV